MAATPVKQLFSLPIPPFEKHPGGTITCTEPRERIYLLTWTSPADNRLTTPFLETLAKALDLVEFSNKPGVLVTTSGIPKFYSNGLDLAHAVATPAYWPLLYSVWKRLLTYPMPTVAYMNGHAYAGGLMTAMAHDYRIAPSPRGYLCANELLFGAHLPPAMSAIFRHKLPASVCRSIALEAHAFPAAEAISAGIADTSATSLEEALDWIEARKLKELGTTKEGIYTLLKAEMYKDLIAFMEQPGLGENEARFAAMVKKEAERREFGKVWYEQWQKDEKAKL
jgi:enoyl-CoA hydratase/carnithine racemase